MTTWQPDILGDGYEQLVLPLGDDPDAGIVRSTLDGINRSFSKLYTIPFSNK